MPRTLRKVSCWPANDASGRSSAVAEERTAKVASGLSAARRSYSLRIAASRAGGNGCCPTQPRISAPASARARTSSVSRRARRSPIRLARPPSARNWRKACEVVAKPPGTRTPDWLSWLIISPRDAFLPPTASTSVILRCSKRATRADARWVDDMGTLEGREKPLLPGLGRVGRNLAVDRRSRASTRRRRVAGERCGGGRRIA